MQDDPNIVVFSRPTPAGDRMAFGICGLGAFGILLYFLRFLWEQDRYGPDYIMDRLWSVHTAVLAGLALTGISLLAVAWRGGTNTIRIDRKARLLREVARIGPLKAIDRCFAFKELGAPSLRPENDRQFIVEVDARERVAVQIGSYVSRAEAEAVLQTIVAALDVAEPAAEPVSPAALNTFKAGSLAARGSMDPTGF